MVDWAVCCAPQCRERIDPWGLTCSAHWRELTPGCRRAWRDALREMVRGIPADLPHGLSDTLGTRLVERAVLARRRATLYLVTKERKAPIPYRRD